MKKNSRWKPLITAMMALILVLQPVLCQADAFAEQEQVQTVRHSYVTPGYESLFRLDQEGEERQAQEEAPVYGAAEKTFTSQAKAVNYMKQQMLQRKTTITFTIKGVYISSVWDQFDVIFDKATQDTASTKPAEGDYLRWNTVGYEASAVYNDQEPWYTFTYKMQYCASASQEKQVDAKIPQVLSSLNLSGKTVYGKVKSIYDYVCSHVTYDYAGLSRGEVLSHSTYKALLRGTAVCQGYATLIYRLMRESGIPCRVITGYSSGEAHGWNIVKIGSQYYNMDSTWDAGRDGDYGYFLKSDGDFPDHRREYTYQSSAFRRNYPVAAASFDPVDDKPGTPRLVSAVATAYNKIKVTWNKSSGAQGYYVYRKYGGNSWQRIGSVSESTVSFVDTKVSLGVTYTYTVRAYRNNQGKNVLGGYMNAGVKAATSLAVPKVKAVIVNKKQTKVTWNGVSGATGYVVYRKLAGTSSYQRLKVVSGNVREYKDNTVKSGKSYVYTVKAYRKVASKNYYSSYKAVAAKAA